MKFADLQVRVLQAALDGSPMTDRELAERVIKLTLAGVDLHVSSDGEIYNPAPDPKFMPAGMEAKWGGGAIRRRRGPGR